MKRPNVHFERGPIGWLQRYALLSYDHPFAVSLSFSSTMIGELRGVRVLVVFRNRDWDNLLWRPWRYPRIRFIRVE